MLLFCFLVSLFLVCQALFPEPRLLASQFLRVTLFCIGFGTLILVISFKLLSNKLNNTWHELFASTIIGVISFIIILSGWELIHLKDKWFPKSTQVHEHIELLRKAGEENVNPSISPSK